MPKTPRALVLVLAGLALLYGAGWFYLSARFAEAVALWLDAGLAEGVAVARAGLGTLGGFPLRLEARLIEPSVRFAVGGKIWTWRPERAVFSAAPWAPARVTLDLSGEHAVFAGAAPVGASSPGPRWTVAARTLSVTAQLDGPAARALDFAASGLAVKGRRPEGDFGAASLGARWRRAAGSPADRLSESQSFEIAGEGLRLPDQARPPLGPEIARIEISGRVMGELASLRSGMGPGALGAWRDDGGTVEIARLDARYGALAVSGDGTLALDGAMQPIAAMTARIEGFAEAIDALRDRGALAGRDAAAAKLVLTALSRREADGRARLAVPLTLQDGVLFVGPVALLRVPPIPWPIP